MADVSITALGRTPDGHSVERYVLANTHGVTAEIMTYGATLTALRTPDRAGQVENVALGFDTLEPYLAGTPYFGATVGRYANRIAGARFELDGREYKLAANDGDNSLHGGDVGFDKALWHARPFRDASAAGVAFSHLSPDGDEGYPGALPVEAIYTLSDDDTLSIEYRATTTKPTHVNLTHHSYFNLSGAARREITGHELQIDADRYAPTDAERIPTGQLRPVAHGPFDFRRSQTIGSRIDDHDDQLRIAGGYDHSFVLNKTNPSELTRAAVLFDPRSGRTMELWTTEPALQVYSGNALDGALSGGAYKRRTGLCLEPQHLPNTPNEPLFASTVLRPGETYQSRTVLHFRTQPA